MIVSPNQWKASNKMYAHSLILAWPIVVAALDLYAAMQR